MTETDRAWAAGFFDGEGHTRFQLVKGKYRAITMRVPQTTSNVEVLETFKDIVGVGTISKEYETEYKPVRYWYVSKLDTVQKALDVIWPYLHIAKRVQAQKAISDYTGNPMPDNVTEMTSDELIEIRGIDNMLDNILGTGKKHKSRKNTSWFGVT